MRQGYKVIVVTFAGRKKCMEILFSYIRKYKEYIDCYQIYVATENAEDIDYIRSFYEENAKLVKLIYHPDNIPFGKHNLWNIAYTQSKEEDAIYIKLDDDIVYLNDTLFTSLIDYRLDHPEYILVYPLIINNLMSSWYLQEWGLLNYSLKTEIGTKWKDTSTRIFPYIKSHPREGFKIGDLTNHEEVLCPISWGNTDFCINAHNTFLKDLGENDLYKYYGKSFELSNYEPMSIQCCCWFGKDMKILTQEYGEVYEDEPWLAVFAPIWSDRKNAVYRNSIVSHYSYYIQHNTLEQTDILSRYKSLAPE